MAIREAYKFVRSRSLNNVTIETDSKIATKAITSNAEEVQWEIQAVINDIQLIRQELSENNITLFHITRKANALADWLTKSDFLFLGGDIWGNIPTQFSNIMQKDIMYSISSVL